MSDSTRFFVITALNMVICSQAKKRLGKDGKQISLKKYLKFIIFMVLLLGLNQLIFFFFQPNNLYEEIEITRNMPISEIKAHQKTLVSKIMSQTKIPRQVKIQTKKRVDEIVKVLSHPARRLSYDTFGLSQTEYAWVFKNQNFLLQEIISSAMFYIICIVMNMMGKNRDQMKQALKIEIMLIFLVFLWEIEIIMQAETRFHQHTDWIDSIYPAFAIFERRELMKVLLFPITNVCDFFLHYYMPNQSEKKLMKVAKHPTLRNLTMKVRDHLNKIKQSQHIEDRVQVAVSELKGTQPIPCDIYLLHRHLVNGIYNSEKENILVDKEILQVLQSFHLLNLQKPRKEDEEEDEEDEALINEQSDRSVGRI